MTTTAPVREPAWPLSRSAIGLWVLHGVVGAIFDAITVAVLFLFVPVSAGWIVPVLRWLVPIVAVAHAVAAIGVQPRLRYRVHRWEVTADAVYTQTGLLTRTWTLVPISRIQTVDVTRGVLQQMFGLATVAVMTASSQGTVQIPHLDADVAQRVADDLAHRAEQARDQAT